MKLVPARLRKQRLQLSRADKWTWIAFRRHPAEFVIYLRVSQQIDADGSVIPHRINFSKKLTKSFGSMYTTRQ